MGCGREYKCKECGKRYSVALGGGFSYPKVYERTINEISDGEYGPELKAVFESTPYAAINAGKVLFYCSKCKSWETGQDLSIYAPNNVEQLMAKEFGAKTVEEWGGLPYAMKHLLEEDFHLLKEDVHYCKNCGAVMDKIDDVKDFSVLPCPKCGTENEPGKALLMWD